LPTDTLAETVTVLAAAAALLWGIYQYRKGQIIQRQQVLFELIKELNESKDLIHAKDILGYHNAKHPGNKWRHKDDPDYYSDKNLPKFLSYQEKRTDEDDPGELEIRISFDNFIVFLGKIGYSLKVGSLKRHEIIYFQYYIRRTMKNEVVTSYIEQSEFPLYRILLRELKKYGILRRWSKGSKWESEVDNLLPAIQPTRPH
jgi:hypothetical protein